MDDWQKDWWKQIENTTETVEKFFNDVSVAIESFSAEVTDVIEDLSEQIQDTVEAEIDRFIDFVEAEDDRQADSDTESNDENEFNIFWEEVKNSIKDFIDFEAEYTIERDFNIWEDIENFMDDSDFVEITTETPTKDNHTACINCSNYHGQAYNGQILVCAMHPYGVEDNTCPDWEQSTSNYHDFF